MNTTAIKYATYDPSALVFSEVKKNTSGGKTIYLKRDADKHGAIFELPITRIPFGLSSYTDTKTGKTSYSVDISLDDPEMVKFFKSIENSVLDHVIARSDEVLGKVYSREVAESALFKSCIRYGKEPGKYPPTLKLKVLTERDGSLKPKCYNSERAPFPLMEIEKGQNVKTIIDVNQIWVVDNKFGVTIRLQQIMAMPNNNLPECAFAEDDPDEEVVDE
jgi:hypothetical protein